MRRRAQRRSPKRGRKIAGGRTARRKRPRRKSEKSHLSTGRSIPAPRKGARGGRGSVGDSQPPDPVADEVRAAVGHVANYDPTMIADSFVLTGPPLNLKDYQLLQLKDDLNLYIHKTKPKSSLSDADVQASGLKVGGLTTKVKSKLKSGKVTATAAGSSSGRPSVLGGARK